MEHSHMGWQCPCCRRVYAPSVFECAPCSGIVTTTPGTLPYVEPFVVPTIIWPVDGTGDPMLPPYVVTSDSSVISVMPDGSFWQNGERLNVTPTGEMH